MNLDNGRPLIFNGSKMDRKKSIHECYAQNNFLKQITKLHLLFKKKSNMHNRRDLRDNSFTFLHHKKIVCVDKEIKNQNLDITMASTYLNCKSTNIYFAHER